MGTSNWQNISYCIELIRDINPKKILDIGIGFGRWGILCREFLEVWEGNGCPDIWNIRVDGVEIFNKNIQEYHKHFYSNIYQMDAFDYIISTGEQYDLIIIGDVLEHFEKSKALVFLRNCCNRADFVLLNIPVGKYWKQSEKYSNSFEEHLSFWKLSEFKEFKCISKKRFRDEIFRKFYVFLFSNNRTLLKRISLFSKISLRLSQYPKFKERLKSIRNVTKIKL